MFYRKFVVRKFERALLYKDGDFYAFLAPGVYRYLALTSNYELDRFDMSKPEFEHRLEDYFLQSERELVSEAFDVVETGIDEVALVYINDQVSAVLGPSQRKMYFKGYVKLKVERFDLNVGLAVERRVARLLVASTDGRVKAIAKNAVVARIVPEGHTGLLYVDGEIVATLGTGLHAYFNVDRVVTIDLIDMRVRTLEVQGQEILTSDKVALRINLSATYQYEDAALALRKLKDPLDHLYKEIQFGLRAAVGTRTLDALLEDKTSIDEQVAMSLRSRFGDVGISVKSVGVKDIILPGDMKELLAKVVEADKMAQANVIRRREETNATRSLLNTAKVMEGNSVALRLKELETLERVTEKVGSLSVYGGLDNVMDGLVRLKQ